MDWEGQAFLGVGALVYVGTVGHTTTHLHAAHQILSVSDGGRVTVDLDDETIGPTSSMVIPGGVAHALRPVDPRVTAVSVYVDVDTVRGHLIGDAIADTSPWEWSDLPSSVVGEWHRGSVRDADDAGRRIVDFLGAPEVHPDAMGVHPFVTAAVDAVSRRLPDRVTLAEVAAQVNVSVPHLSRLWRDDLRISFPAWVRWARLRSAATLIGGGATITDAAHGAGFADGAHASRVCREMFGLSPLELSTGVVVI
ncbi:helix-turn-helix transcriptional regulator [Gordonia soli]|uniref:Putative AraC family transcriptional regulator n=1 Tax=Gordonia soli NBRC 108243 TaxID=1223545 RepID=M0QIC4_9ACTN|nr:helix-turn-helix transcriptional regulator [Gordonia soli]GAC67187.1 putative AraC family transcriptional regulator [Gordonia soli NBRC 108243]